MHQKFHFYVLKSDRLFAMSLDMEINTAILNEIRQVSKFSIWWKIKCTFSLRALENNQERSMEY